METKRTVRLNLLVYGAAHALVDAICAAVLTSLAFWGGLQIERVLMLYLLYNFLAFAMQAPLGLLLDRTRTPRAAARAGLLLQAVALGVFPWSPEGGILSAGLGNALFHLGGGVVALTLTPGRAACPGIFVAPGAVGLFLGISLGAKMPLPTYLCVLAGGTAMFFSAAVSFLPLPTAYAERPAATRTHEPLAPGLFAAVLLIFLSITIRSFVGLSLSFPWKSRGVLYGLALATAAGGGKAIGGFLADRFGFTRTCIGALLVSIPLIWLGEASVVSGLAGCLFFQMTMAVTLVAYVDVFPGREAYAFGLACLALFAGSLPLLLPVREVAAFADLLATRSSHAVLTLVSIFCLYRGFRAIWGERRG